MVRGYSTLLLLKKIRKRLPGVGRSSGRRFAFDDGSGREQLAFVPGALVRDSRGNWFATLEARAWIEGSALAACVKIGVALRAGSINGNVRLDSGSAPVTFHLCPEGHH